MEKYLTTRHPNISMLIVAVGVFALPALIESALRYFGA